MEIGKRTLGALAALGLTLIAGVGIAARPVHREREVIDSTPAPPPLFNITPVGLLPAEPEICLSDVTLGPESQVLRFRYLDASPPRPLLRVSATGPGYQSAAVVRPSVQAGSLDAPITAPTNEMRGRVCVRSMSPQPLSFVATLERRTKSRPVTSIVGRPIPADVALTTLERKPRSILERPGELLRHAAAFKPRVVTPLSLGVLSILIAISLPAGTLWALLRADQA
jgi:hypothetical protein